MEKKILIFVLGLLYSSSCLSQKFQILDLQPGRSIQIGRKRCFIKSIFDINDKIYWSDSAKYIKARPTAGGALVEVSKVAFKNQNLSLNNGYFRSGKLVYRDITCGIQRQYIISTKNDVDTLAIKPENGYIYKLQPTGINMSYPGKLLLIENNNLIIRNNDLDGMSGVITGEVWKISETDPTDIETIIDLTIEIIN